MCGFDLRREKVRLIAAPLRSAYEAVAVSAGNAMDARLNGGDQWARGTRLDEGDGALCGSEIDD